MDPQIQGAVLGAGATALGGAIAWVGARAQAGAALESVRMQVRGQQFDARWQMRRDAYAAFFGAVEEVRTAVADARGIQVVRLQHPDQTLGGTAPEARMAVAEVMKRLWFQQSLLRLSVSSLERMATDSLVEQVTGLVRYLDEWWEVALQNSLLADELDERLRSRSGELVEVIEHVMESARGWLDANPDVDPPGRRQVVPIACLISRSPPT
ncbi:hypothetical protein [Streptomyces sp. STR69]|uniref:hypothetical protein n=1 Tax=Streptomyces sp. STR69 TaxID=1796942 RepID=UPI0021C754E1|nr:hypothetical protein [Streptomyces sp. STR69]